MIKRNTVRVLTAFLAAVIAFAFVYRIPSWAAPTKITIDDEVYNLVTEDGPAEIASDVYSKFVSNVKNIDDYSLMSDEDEAYDSFTAALAKNNVSFNEDYICCFKTTLWDWSGDDEKAVTSFKVESYFPLPSDAQENPESCHFYKLASGTLKEVYPLDLYSIEDELYTKISYNSASDFSAIYGFVYADPDSFEDEDEEEDEGDDEEDEGDEDEDDLTPTPTLKPTKAPTAAPTAVPTDKANKPTSTENKNDNKKNGSGSGGKKDSIPKTGDDFPLGGIVATSAVSLVVLGGVIILLKKNKQ